MIQHVLEHGRNQDDKNVIVQNVLGQTLELSNHKFASNVVEKCLQYGVHRDIERIIDEIIYDPTSDGDLN